jgi:hypothetical protein
VQFAGHWCARDLKRPSKAEAQGQFVALEEPVTLRIGSSSADNRLEQKVAVVAAK